MSNAREITARLGGRWYGGPSGYGMVRCPCHEDRAPSLRLRDGDRGLLVHDYAGCRALDVLTELRRRGVLEGEATEADERRLSEMAKRRAAEDRRGRLRREQAALSIWRASRPAALTLAEVYLRCRAITMAVPASIRYHPGLRHSQTGLELPAMVAGVQAPDRQVRGVHRTFLTLDGTRKAPVTDARLSLGTLSGGAVRLATATGELAIGEGIETCLSYQQETGTPTWAALSTAGLRSIVLPELPIASSVVILVDADDAGEQAAQAAALRFTGEGRRVELARPTIGKDMNDALREAINA